MLLEQVASDCYRAGAFSPAARGYALLAEAGPQRPGLWGCVLGACLGVVRAVAMGSEPSSCLR